MVKKTKQKMETFDIENTGTFPQRKWEDGVTDKRGL